MFFSTVPTLLWLIQRDLWVTTVAARVHLRLVLNWLCLGLPMSSAKLLPWPYVISSLGQDLVFALDPTCIGPFFKLLFLFFQPVKILLHTSPTPSMLTTHPELVLSRGLLKVHSLPLSKSLVKMLSGIHLSIYP